LIPTAPSFRAVVSQNLFPNTITLHPSCSTLCIPAPTVLLLRQVCCRNSIYIKVEEGSAGFNALHASLTADETETDTDVAIDDIEELIMTKYV
jgi:hypothetical protein